MTLIVLIVMLVYTVRHLERVGTLTESVGQLANERTIYSEEDPLSQAESKLNLMFGVVDTAGDLIDLDGIFEVKLTRHQQVTEFVVPAG